MCPNFSCPNERDGCGGNLFSNEELDDEDDDEDRNYYY